jgi:hypothetical protein
MGSGRAYAAKIYEAVVALTLQKFMRQWSRLEEEIYAAVVALTCCLDLMLRGSLVSVFRVRDNLQVSHPDTRCRYCRTV